MSEPDRTSFGAWLRQRRRSLGVTQKELAQQVDCAEITIRKIEANDLRPSRRLALMMLRKLGVPRREREPLVQLARQR